MPPDPIIVTADDIERLGHRGRRSNYRYRRIRILSIDAWGTVIYDQSIDLGRDAQVWIAKILELKLAGFYDGQAKAWIEEHSPIWIPNSDDHESLATIANPRPIIW